MVTASFTGREGFAQAFQPRLNLGAMTASMAAHAIVVALLVITWREETLMEGGTPSALVSIDLAAQEGGPGPRTMAPVEAHQAPPTPTPIEAQDRPETVSPRPLPSRVASPPAETMRAERAGGGEGRTGSGAGGVSTRPMVVTPVSARAFAPPSAPSPAVVAG
ncbi:hypothetical protein PMI02_02939, partial [Novosphingobium sp. AP12]